MHFLQVQTKRVDDGYLAIPVAAEKNTTLRTLKGLVFFGMVYIQLQFDLILYFLFEVFVKTRWR